MNTFKKISVFGAALLITSAMGSAYAVEDADMLQTRTQDRVRTEVNTQAPAIDFDQYRSKQQKMVKTQSQNQNQYKYMNNYRKGQSTGGFSSMNGHSTGNRSMSGGRH